ncbi:MAG: 16S rRNA (cytosine(1402)-N(4))-methyltransferase RsmH [Alphaproteobacteria bacterium]
MNSDLSHVPVMVNEVVSFLNLKKKKNLLDCTFGQGGYSKKILEESNCNVFALDRDKESIGFADVLKKKYGSRFNFENEKFSTLESVLSKKGVSFFDGIVIDLGISNTQLKNPMRGFSFSNDGPLDMRMDQHKTNLTAEIVINEYSEKELANIFFYYGEERNSRRIARSIIKFRERKRINTTKILSEIISKINKSKFKNPSTRVFQALRIFVNDELDELEKILELSMRILNSNSRIVILAFHSLEDKIIKNFFRTNQKKDNSQKYGLKLITKKPVTPSSQEIKENPSSRSAKLRVAEKI